MPRARRTSPRGPSAPTTNRAATRSCAPVARSRSVACTPSPRSTSPTSSTPNRTSPPRSRRWSSSTGSMWSCGTHAGSDGLTASTARGSVGKPMGRPSGSAVRRVGDTEHSGCTPRSPARIGSVTPQERKISIVRVLTAVARGKIDVAGWRSTRSTRAPLRAALMAVASPAGPAPMMRMSCVMATTIGEPARHQLRADYGVKRARSLGPVRGTRLGQQVGDVRLDRARGEEEPLRDLGVAEAVGHQREDVHLPAGHASRPQRGGHRRGAAASARRRPGPAEQVTAGAGELVVAEALVFGEVGPQRADGVDLRGPAVGQRRVQGEHPQEPGPPRRVGPDVVPFGVVGHRLLHRAGTACVHGVGVGQRGPVHASSTCAAAGQHTGRLGVAAHRAQERPQAQVGQRRRGRVAQ